MAHATQFSTTINYSDVESHIRRDLAALYRLCLNYGWTDLTLTHLSARLTDQSDHYLINTPDMLFDEICASNLSKFTFDGDIIGPPRLINRAGHIIHSNVLKARKRLASYLLQSGR